MFRLVRLCVLALMLLAAFEFGSICNDRQVLSEDVIRLHIVAASDSQEDQDIKLRVRDAVLVYLQQAMGSFGDAAQAHEYLLSQLDEIENVAQNVLAEFQISDSVSVSLTQETFDTRHYDTFSLPAGVYQALRIVIGEGEGENWWCVVFPSLCTVRTDSEFAVQAAGAGFTDRLSQTVRKEETYEIRFWLLDMLGRVQNFFLGR